MQNIKIVIPENKRKLLKLKSSCLTSLLRHKNKRLIMLIDMQLYSIRTYLKN